MPVTDGAGGYVDLKPADDTVQFRVNEALKGKPVSWEFEVGQVRKLGNLPACDWRDLSDQCSRWVHPALGARWGHHQGLLSLRGWRAFF